MTKQQLEKLWSESELAKRINATELFFILHGGEEWKGETIPEFLKRYVRAVIEEVRPENRVKEASWDDLSHGYNLAVTDLDANIIKLFSEETHKPAKKAG